MCHLNPHYFQKYTRINCRIIFFFCFLNTNTVVIFVNECPFWILHYRLTKCLFMWIKSVIQTTKDLYSHGWPSQVLKSLCYRLAWRSADLYDRWTSSSKTLSLELHWSLSSKPCTVGHALILHWLETNHPDVRGDYIVLGTALGRTYKIHNSALILEGLHGTRNCFRMKIQNSQFHAEKWFAEALEVAVV